MKYLKIIGSSMIWFFVSLFSLLLLVTLLSYFNILNYKIIAIIKIVIPIISMFISGVIMGKNASKQGWLEGLKFGSIIFIFCILFNYIFFKQYVNLRFFIFYFVLIISSISGSMFGINRKVK